MKYGNNSSSLSSQLWSIILSGGEGQRMRPFIERWLGRHIPKQYCTFVGTRSMLQHTWDRADRLTAPHQKITVFARLHQAIVYPNLQPSSTGQLIFQPNNRDTAVGVFFPLTYIRAWNPEATVIVYPSDHFVYPEDLFMKRVHAAVRATEHWSDRIIILGSTPTRMEADYGWVEKSGRLGWSSGSGLWSVGSFKEKPTSSLRWSTVDSGWLWNTMVVIAKLKTLWAAGWRCFPEVMERFTALGEVIGTQQEGAMLETIYDDMPCRNYSSDLLGQSIEHLGVMEMHDVLWSDWGRPEWIIDALKDIGRMPSFPIETVASPALTHHVRNGALKVG